MAEQTLNRRVSLLLLSLYGIGTILGAGIYVLIGKVAGAAGMFTPISFLVAALLAAFSAFSYAELSSRFPKSAGEAVYIEQGFNLRWLSIFVGLLIAVVGMVSTATLIHGFFGYLQEFIELPRALVIITVSLILGSIVAWGIAQSVFIAGLITVVEIIGLLMVLWVTKGSFITLPTHLPEMIPNLDGLVWSGIVMGAFIAFYAFIGFEDIVNMAEEVKNPQKTLPRAIIIALVTTTVLYIVVALASILTMPIEALSSSEAPLADIYAQATSGSANVIIVISLFSIINGAMVQIIMASRVIYGMSKQGWLPTKLGEVNAKTKTPLIATGLTIFCVISLALIFPLLSLAKLTSFITLVVFALINLALWIIKGNEKFKASHFSIPRVLPLIGFFVSSGFIVLLTINILS